MFFKIIFIKKQNSNIKELEKKKFFKNFKHNKNQKF